MAELGTATFASSVRSGRLQAPAAAAGAPRLRADMSLTVTRDQGAGVPVSTTLEFLGPGDVVGIAPAEILRVFPRNAEPAAEPNYLVSIEFDSPELPWVLSLDTGASAVLPWILLVVVPDGPDRVENRSGSMLPWLLADAAELPPPDEAWAWAHAHAQGGASLAAPAPGDGRQTLSRLLSPTRLQPLTRYLAAVVPAYRAGVLAALRQNPADAGAQRSWTPGDGTVELPMYHHWRFTTGVAGDFEELARRLTPVDASQIPGLGRLDLALAEGGLAGVDTSALLPVRTLLLSAAEDAARDAEAAAPEQGVADALARAIEPGSADERMVRPPKYGQWPAGDVAIGDGPAWLAQLNLQPHHRVVARVGADIVRAQQEELVAEAQRQLGEYRAARRTRDLLRLGEMTADRLTVRGIAAVQDERLVTALRPVLPALMGAAGDPVAESMVADGFGASLLGGSLVQLARRATTASGESATSIRAQFVGGAMDGTLVRIRDEIPAPAVDIERTRSVFARAGILDHQVAGIPLERLLTLGPAARKAQDDLFSRLRDRPVEVRPVDPAPVEAAPVGAPPKDDGGLLRKIRGSAGEFDDGSVTIVTLSTDKLHKEVQDDHGTTITTSHGGVKDVHHLRDGLDLEHLAGGEALQHGLVGPDLTAGTLVSGNISLGAGVFGQEALDQGVAGQQLIARRLLPRDVATARIGDEQSAGLEEIVSTATASLRAAAQAEGMTESALTFVDDLVVDPDAVRFVTQQLGQSSAVVLSTRDVVRRSLGLPVVPPVLRDVLTEEGQRWFDGAVTDVAGRQISADLHFGPAPPRITATEVAERCRPLLAVSATYPVAARRRLPFAVEGELPSAIALGFVPVFDAPLAERLQRSQQRWILAGAERVPANAITVLLSNPAFVEALLAGANHEMARELLWRDIPSDPRGTVFRRFWATPTPAGDLTPMHTWRSELGRNLQAASPYLCVLVRSPLLRRYPSAVVQAAQGKLLSTPEGRNFEPTPGSFRPRLFQGEIAPDMTFSVLELTEDEVRAAKPGEEWYLLLGEPVTEPKFGMDAERPAGSAARGWDDLAWSDAEDGPFLRTGDARLRVLSFDGMTWGTDAAAIARILHQDPFRLVLPAADFLRSGA